MNKEKILFAIAENHFQVIEYTNSKPNNPGLMGPHGGNMGYSLSVTKKGILIKNSYKKNKNYFIEFNNVIEFKKERGIRVNNLILDLLFKQGIIIKFKENSKTNLIGISSYTKKDINQIFDLMGRYSNKAT